VQGRGVSCVLYEGNNGYSALVAEVSVDQATGIVTVTRLVASQDSGPVSNPGRFYGIRWKGGGALARHESGRCHEEVKWTNRGITSFDWRSYPVYQFGDPLPVVETVLINPLNVPQLGGRRMYDHHRWGGDRQRRVSTPPAPAFARDSVHTPRAFLAALAARSSLDC